jgi:threonine/homoserine/homoserine lactone efflux protein
MDDVNLLLILSAGFVTTASPGPSTLMIAGTAMSAGRRTGLILAMGVLTGSVMWSAAAALGLSALMVANAWLFEVFRYIAALYLLWLAWRSARSALRTDDAVIKDVPVDSPAEAYVRGLGVHLTNPKVILFFGSLYALGIPNAATPIAVALVVLLVAIQSAVIFVAYALLFSHATVRQKYARLRRWFEAAFALLFGVAGLRVLFARAPV